MSRTDQAPKDGGEAKVITLMVKVATSKAEVYFKVKMTTLLTRLMKAFCENQGITMDSVRFSFDGEILIPADEKSVAQYDMEDGDKIDVYGIEPKLINLKVATSTTAIYYKCKMTTPLIKILKAFCERLGIAMDSARFILEGESIVPSGLTLKDYGMEDGDTIDVFTR